MIAGQQLVTHAREPIDVVAWIRICGFLRHLRAGVCGSHGAKQAAVVHGHIALGLVRSSHRSSDTEIEDFHLPALHDEAVARLEVGMHDAVLMGIHQCSAHPFDQRESLPHRARRAHGHWN